MTGNFPDSDPTPATPEELGEQARATREQLARTLEALVGRTEVKEKAGDIKGHVEHFAAEAKGRAVQAAHLLQESAPETVREAAAAARRNRAALFVTVGAALAVLFLLRRGRRKR
ncbi:DUF3618 domain-containing protein [Streptomyces sp. NPDC057445]|uniref:DUF3618 domain-containing protein n=1 Tax=Streptomyces sp. NPDC057445 TaxID=3346136 RepID=UPI00369AE9CA